MIEVTQEFDIRYIDASSICKFNRCPAAYLFSRQLGLTLPESSMIAPHFGTCIHSALPYCYEGVDNIDYACEVFNKEWDSFCDKFGYVDGNDDKRNKIVARQMLADFAKHRDPAYCPYEIVKLDIEAPTKDKISKNEIPFLIDIGASLAAAGRIDIPIRWRSDRSLWCDDYKTASEISARFFKNFMNAPQTILYTLALSHITGEKVQGMIIEALRVSKNNRETAMQFIFVKDHQIASFLRLAQDTADEITKCNKEKKWPKKCTGCSPYSMFGGAGRTCEYLDICDHPDWEDGARIYRKNEPFHPFEIEVD